MGFEKNLSMPTCCDSATSSASTFAEMASASSDVFRVRSMAGDSRRQTVEEQRRD